MASLIVTKGTGEGDFHRLAEGTNVIGRAVDLPIHLLDMTVSREHLEIARAQDGRHWEARDLGSTHGVLINGVAVRRTVPLGEGDTLTVGRIELLFTLTDVSSREEAFAVVERSRPDCPTMPVTASSMLRNDNGRQQTLQGLRRWAGGEKATLAVVFTDIVDSTLLTHELGNERMEQVRRAHFARARKIIEARSGFEIKTNGDEFMVAFRTAVDALDFVLDLTDDAGDARVRIRAGVHIGPVVVETEDVQGAAVSYAARLVALAAGGGVRVSGEVKNHLDQEKARRHGAVAWQRHPDCEIRGFPGRHELWSVDAATELP